uniref:hypothetical protein n=1 Tax=Candidatus Electrothrix sp. TaxID=2170559 RepID=UPI0040567EA6
MKKYLLFVLFLAPILSNGQAWKNSNILKGTEDVYLLSSITDNESNTIIYGYFNGSLTPKDYPQVDSRGGRDFFLAKYDTLSNLIWLKGIGGSFNEFFDGSAAVDAAGNIYITGGFQDSLAYTELDTIVSTGFHDIFLSKYDPDGNNLWCINAGSGSSFQRSTTLDIDNQGNILMGGYYNDSISISGDTTLDANQFKDYFYAKFEPLAGDLIWAKALKSIDSNYSGFIYAISSADDHYVFSGVFGDSVDITTDTLISETPGYYDTHIFKTDLNGDIQWTREVKGVRWDYSYTSTLDAENNIYVTGYTDSPTLIIDSTESESITRDDNFGSYDFFIAKYDTDGTLQWVKRNGGSADDRLINSTFYDGNLWVTGYFADTLRWGAQILTTNGPSDRDMFYGSIDADGNYSSATKYNGRNNSVDEGYGVFYDSKGNLYAVIRTNSDLFIAGDSSYINTTENFVIILGAVGCLPITVAEVISEHLDVAGCFGDSTGRIEIEASGGFGQPWEYSLGVDYPFQPSPTFNDLPAGSYVLEAKDSR